MIWRSNDPNDPRVIEESQWRGSEKPLATAYLNFLCLLEGEDMPIVTSFANTSYQAGRKLFTLTKMTSGPVYYCKYALTSLQRTNSLGTFYVFEVAKIGPTEDAERQKAQELSEVFAGKDLNFESEEKPEPKDLPNEF